MSQLGVDAIVRELAKVGIALKREWVSACVAHLERSDARFATMPPEPPRERVLPAVPRGGHATSPARDASPRRRESVASTRDGQLSGRFVLQADELIDVGASFNDRYSEKPAKVDRTLKLSLTDGVTRVVAYEYRPIAQLGVHVSAGCKIAVVDARVRDGALFLQPENVTTLGGVVERLEAARRRAVDEWRQPNRPKLGAGARGGRRTRRQRSRRSAPAATSGFGLDDGGGGRAGGAAEHAGVPSMPTEGTQGCRAWRRRRRRKPRRRRARAAMEAAAAAVKAAGEVAEAAAPFAIEAPVSSAAPDAAAGAGPGGRTRGARRTNQTQTNRPHRRQRRGSDADAQAPADDATVSSPSRLGTRRSSSAAADAASSSPRGSSVAAAALGAPAVRKGRRRPLHVRRRRGVASTLGAPAPGRICAQ